jgi:hypothetical protein
MQVQIDEAVGETDALRTTSLRLVADLDQAENSRTYLGAALREVQSEVKDLQPVVKLKAEYERAMSAMTEVIELLRRINPDSPTLQGCRVIPDSVWAWEQTNFTMVELPVSRGPDEYATETYDVRRLDLYQLEVELRDCSDFTDSMQFSVSMTSRDGRPALAAMRKSAQAMLHMAPNQIARELAPYVKQALQERFG